MECMNWFPILCICTILWLHVLACFVTSNILHKVKSYSNTCRRQFTGVQAQDIVLVNIRDATVGAVDFDMYVQSANRVLNQQALLEAVEVSNIAIITLMQMCVCVCVWGRGGKVLVLLSFHVQFSKKISLLHSIHQYTCTITIK